ncbi:hypothetical protein STCU_12234 [Strigomonas culicis]|uniref:Protein kinase domain-containing protein n=1 Tax=Strigomonas culicis TaxID=28005 RepID=S9UXF8_9TRYP|nr:hypothetical protein STCU_12234 [Strigomonas culicis]|eukprot:EPY15220.1 hypothetical protein STCU_12234 [Strigomonas culicis]
MEVDTQQLLLVLEYASGGSVVSMYQNFRPIPEHLFYQHALGIARGLKHLHDHNVIHGDVKPENVLTRSDGSVALSDFGCSSLPVGADGTPCSTVGREVSSTSIGTDTGGDDSNYGSPTFQLFGTAAYMAPEVILNEPCFKSDVWAYVCMLVYMWTGILPWSTIVEHFTIHDTIPLIFLIGNEDKLPYREEDILRTPRWLQKLCAGVLERDVSKRFSITEVLALLAEYEHICV